MSDKPTLEVFVTPVGELVFPWITRADIRYDPDGVFQTKLLLPFDSTGAQELIAKLEGTLKNYIATLDVKKQKTLNQVPVFTMELDEEGEETGNVLFKAKLKQNVTPHEGEPFTQHITVVDAMDGTAITEAVYGGTMAKLKGQIVPYTNMASQVVGVTMRMRAVQVHELVTGSGSSGAFWSDFG